MSREMIKENQNKSAEETSVAVNVTNNFTFVKPLATSSPTEPHLKKRITASVLNDILSKHVELEREKVENLKKQIVRNFELALMKMDNLNEIYYSIDDGHANPVQEVAKKGQEKENVFKVPRTEDICDSSVMTRQKTKKLKRHVTMNVEPDKEWSPPKRTPMRTPRNYQIAAVTPGPNINAPTSILRRPNPGEVAISISGSPLLLTSDNALRSISQITIPLKDGRVMAVLGNDGLDADEFPPLNREVKKQLEKLHKFLGKAISKQ